MDYAKPPKYYDTFALRDADGEEAIMPTWPYFRASASRAAMKNNRPVPVASCWNGMGKLIYLDARQWNYGLAPTKSTTIPLIGLLLRTLGRLFVDPCPLYHDEFYVSGLILSLFF